VLEFPCWKAHSAQAMAVQSSQITNANLREGKRESRRYRIGRTRYICISNGRDHRKSMDLLCVRFWVSKIFEKRAGHPIQMKPPAPLTAGILNRTTAMTTRMLSG